MALAELEPLAGSAAVLAAVFVLGTLWGSFANVCIYRWPPTDQHPHGRSVISPGSHCGACGKPVRWYDNVPILAWLWLRGRCRDCGTRFSARYLLVEALTGVLFVAAWWFAVQGRAGLEPFDARLIRFAIGASFAVVMVVVLFIDLDHMLILDRVTLPSLAGFYGAGLLLSERHWTDGIIGAAVGFALVRVVADLFLLIRGRVGMGMGDGKLLAVVGALLGWKGPVVSLFLGATVASVVTIPLLLARRLVGGAGDEGGEDGGGDRAEADGDGPGEADGDHDLDGPLPWEARRSALWSLSFIMAAMAAVTWTHVPPWIVAALVVVAALVDDFFHLTDPWPAGDGEGGDGDGDGSPGDGHGGEVDELDVGPGAVPFGPFLALAALTWWFAEPYVMFRLTGSWPT